MVRPTVPWNNFSCQRQLLGGQGMSEQQPRNLFQLLLIDIWIIITWQNWIDNMRHILRRMLWFDGEKAGHTLKELAHYVLATLVISVNETQIQQQIFKRCWLEYPSLHILVQNFWNLAISHWHIKQQILSKYFIGMFSISASLNSSPQISHIVLASIYGIHPLHWFALSIRFTFSGLDGRDSDWQSLCGRPAIPDDIDNIKVIKLIDNIKVIKLFDNMKTF